jgi:hypothetical protein
MPETISPPSAEPGAAVVSPWPNVTEAPDPGGGELNDAKAVHRGDVVVEPPAQVLVELLGSVDVGHGDDLDLEVHVDLPGGRVAAGVVYFGGAHGCLLSEGRPQLVFVLLMPSSVVTAPGRRAR